MFLSRTLRSSSLIALVGLAACDGGETDPGPAPGPTWQLVLSELPGALISVWGTSASDVWAVGGDAGDGPMVVRYDGASWTRLDTGVSGDLWWVHGFANGPVFMGGSDGKILSYENGAFTTMTTPGMGIVFGIWGASPDDLWAVGGGGQATGGFMWRNRNGMGWQAEPTAPAGIDAVANVFKVWGRSPSDVWMVGTGGLTWHYDGTSVVAVTSPTTRTLFTVHGDADRTVAVGGFQSGVILEHDGTAWSDVTPADAPQMTGVCAGSGKLYAAGVYGGVMRREEGAWRVEDTGLVLRDDFHGVWIDPDAGVWAVGGQVAAFPLVRGMLVYMGTATIPSGPVASI